MHDFLFRICHSAGSGPEETQFPPARQLPPQSPPHVSVGSKYSHGMLFVALHNISFSGGSALAIIDHDFSSFFHNLNLTKRSISHLSTIITMQQKHNSSIAAIAGANNSLALFDDQIKNIEHEFYDVLSTYTITFPAAKAPQIPYNYTRTNRAIPLALIVVPPLLSWISQFLHMRDDTFAQIPSSSAVQEISMVYLKKLEMQVTANTKLLNTLVSASTDQIHAVVLNKMIYKLQAQVLFLRSFLNQLRSMLLSLQTQKLTSDILPRPDLMQVLDALQVQLKADKKAFYFPVDDAHLSSFYQLAKSHAASLDGSLLRIVVVFPVIQTPNMFTLYEMHPIPQFIQNSNVAAYYETHHRYLAVDTLHNNSALLSHSDLSSCLFVDPKFCALQSRIFTPTAQLCEMALFFNNHQEIAQSCNIILRAKSPMFLMRMSHKFTNAWVYSVAVPQILVPVCDTFTPNSTIILKDSGTLVIPQNCVLHHKDYQIFSISMYSISKKIATSQRNWYSVQHFNDSLAEDIVTKLDAITRTRDTQVAKFLDKYNIKDEINVDQMLIKIRADRDTSHSQPWYMSFLFTAFEGLKPVLTIFGYVFSGLALFMLIGPLCSALAAMRRVTRVVHL
jgi:hypothetical protein